MCFRLVLLGAAVAATAALARSAVRPTELSHEAYIWQRAWNPQVRAAIASAPREISGWRFLAAQTDVEGRLHVFSNDRRATAEKPTTAVIRIEGQLTDIKGQLGAILGAIGRLRSDMPGLSGIEIDHDCADSRLSDYADLLRRLKPELEPKLRLSITALPTWISSLSLPSVLGSVDEAILQVHAVQSPSAELFNPSIAMRWVEAFAKISPVPFRVSLPNYGVRISRVTSGRSMIESESPLLASGSSPIELMADASAVSQFVRKFGATAAS
jgi:hypothetical protein